MLEEGRNCWRIERASRAALVIDAADYFRLARQAMLRARSQIILIGWDFDTRICLDYDADDGAPSELGQFLTWLPKQRPDLKVYILKWDLGAIKLLGRGTTVLRLARWAASDQINFKLDGAHPTGASHHHKIAVIDDALAFCGGIDMTGDRWDSRAHRDRDPHRKRPTTRRRYQPWHDATMAVDGDAARALGELSRFRWHVAGGEEIAPPQAGSDPWPEALRPHFHDVDVAIARTRGAHQDLPGVREIETLYVDSIQQARKFVYAENQFFASRVIVQAICKRLEEPDGPEFVIVNPRRVDGWLEQKVMGPARARLLQLVEKADRYGRFRIYSPVTEGGEDIYVHSKITVVDDELLRVGSANINNRSMGLDSECDVLIDSRLQANEGAQKVIGDIRRDLIAEHLGRSTAEVLDAERKAGSLIGAIESLRRPGRSLEELEVEEPSQLEKKIADSEALDPESAGDQFEPLSRPGLKVGMRSLLRRRSAA